MSPKLSINSANGYYLYDKDKNLFTGNNNEWINLDNISTDLVNATLAIEDKNFYKHMGFDYLRIVKAFGTNIVSGKTVQGASTITQQYAKNLFLDFDKKWSRKIEEAWLTIRLEVHYSKDEILEGYLNTINYGGVYGIENASKYYFNKSSKDLTLAEASMLAGIPKSPANYAPTVNEKNAKKRQRLILNAMVDRGYITDKEADEAYDTELEYLGIENENNSSTLMYYQDAVIKELKSLKQIPSSFLKTGGLKIYTSLDLEAQNIIDSTIKKHMEDTKLETAIVVMNPKNGEILGIAGGKDYNKSQFNRVTDSKRQVGSTMKPFLYYSALENGFTSTTTFTSEKTTFTFSGNKTYSPKNYNDVYANKPITLAAALSYSDNVFAVKTHLFLGEKELVDFSKRVGITSNLEELPSLALGTEEINILEMMEGYSTFASGGYKIEPHFITKVEDMNGNVLYKYKNEEELILNKNTTFILNELLSNCYNKNLIDYNYPTCFNIAPKITKKYSIKTGTTDTDHLIFGYNPDLLIGGWIGYDDNTNTVDKDGTTLKNMWVEIMESYLKEKEESWYEQPNNVVGVLVNPITGEAATKDTKNSTIMYYIKGTEPNASDIESTIPTIKVEE
ncbi:MAG: PBP1A family penicillin-binding protein [Lactobacillales bacterium]|nr:PBP1A family penicillin-binding protein [Lactobacillales bacterium]